MKRILTGIVIALLVLIVMALILAPGIARRYVVNKAPDLIGRPMAINKLKVNYLGGKVRVIDFILFEPDHRTAFIRFDTLLVDVKPLRLLKNELVVQQFYLSGLQTLVIREDTTFNFTDLIAFHSGETEPDSLVADTTRAEPFKYQLSNIELENSGIVYENRDLQDTMLLRNFSFFIPYLGSDQENESEAKIRFLLKRDGYIEAGINIDPSAGDFDIALTIRKLYLESFSNYMAEFTDIGELKGIFNTQLEVLGNINTPAQSTVSGDIEIKDLYLADNMEREILGAKSICTGFREIDPSRSRFLLDSVILVEPYIFFEKKDSTNNFFEILHYTPADKDTLLAEESAIDSSQTEEPVTEYAVQYFSLQNGSVDFRDHPAGELFDYHLSEIEINTDSIRSTSHRITIRAFMLLNNQGNLVAELWFDPRNPSDFVLDYTISDFNLTDMDIYSRYFTGFPVLYGQMYYKGHTGVINHQMTSENRIVMEEVELGEKSRGLHDVPLKAALYTLKDRNDVIELEIPISGRTDDKQVSIDEIIWNTVKNLIVRIATSPLDFLAHRIGVNPRNIETIKFDYLDTTLTKKQQKQLNELLELEQSSDEMEIELVYYGDPDQEKARLTKAQVKTESLDSLAATFPQVRIDRIVSYLHTSNDSTQIKVVIADPEAPGNVGGQPRFEVKYFLKNLEKSQ